MGGPALCAARPASSCYPPSFVGATLRARLRAIAVTFHHRRQGCARERPGRAAGPAHRADVPRAGDHQRAAFEAGAHRSVARPTQAQPIPLEGEVELDVLPRPGVGQAHAADPRRRRLGRRSASAWIARARQQPRRLTGRRAEQGAVVPEARQARLTAQHVDQQRVGRRPRQRHR